MTDKTADLAGPGIGSYDEIAKIFEGPDDPNYAIVIVRPYRIEVNTFGSFMPEIWEP